MCLHGRRAERPSEAPGRRACQPIPACTFPAKLTFLGVGILLAAPNTVPPGLSRCPVMAINMATALIASAAEGACSTPLPRSMPARFVVAKSLRNLFDLFGSAPP